ncbi:hypothetical protein IGI37_003134 [Enterococcus sp. AZ194]
MKAAALKSNDQQQGLYTIAYANKLFKLLKKDGKHFQYPLLTDLYNHQKIEQTLMSEIDGTKENKQRNEKRTRSAALNKAKQIMEERRKRDGR